MTGIRTASFSRAIRLQSARPVYICFAVRGWRATAATPSPSQIFPSSTKLSVSSVIPARNFTVSGVVGSALRHASGFPCSIR